MDKEKFLTFLNDKLKELKDVTSVYTDYQAGYFDGQEAMLKSIIEEVEDSL